MCAFPLEAAASFEADPELLAAEAERRKHARFPLGLRGRYMLADGAEFACESVDIAVGGVSLRGPRPGRVGERVVAYLEGLGRIEGVVVRRTRDWFAIELRATARKFERLGERIELLVKGGEIPLPVKESASGDEWTSLEVGGVKLSAKLIDISMEGATLAVNAQPPIGSQVLVGQLPAFVARHLPGGIYVDFDASL